MILLYLKMDNKNTTKQFFKACDKVNGNSNNKVIVTRINRTPQVNTWFYGASVVAGAIFWYCS